MLLGQIIYSVPITISDNNGGIQDLRIGIAANATDGIDIHLNEAVLPPLPPTGIFDARLNLPIYPMESSLLDFRNVADENIYEYNLQYQLGAGSIITISFNFDTLGLAQVYGRLQDVITGTFINEIISGIGSYNVTNPSVINRLKLTLIINNLLIVENNHLKDFDYELSQNYPNPFNPTTKIKYTIPEVGHVKLTVYDQIGQKVSEIVNEVRSAGRYEVNFNADKLSSGVYFYKIETGKFNNVKKMMILK